MKLKNLGMALVVVLALAAVAAGSASAATVSTFDAQWYTGSAASPTLLSGSESVSIHGESTLIGNLNGTPVTLESKSVECVGCTIQNTGGAATGSGKLRFKEVTVETPATCAARSVGAATGTVETKPLSVKADYMETSTGTASWALFTPTTGTTFVEIELIKGSGGCAVSGTYTVTGNDYVKASNPTGTFAVDQPITSSGTINAAAGGELKFGNVKAELNTTGAEVTLSGAKAGTAFATK